MREAWFSWVISAAPEALAVPTTRNAATTYSINPLFDAMLLSLLYLIIYVNYDVFYMSFLLFWHLGLIRDCVFAFSLPSWILTTKRNQSLVRQSARLPATEFSFHFSHDFPQSILFQIFMNSHLINITGITIHNKRNI